MTKLMEDNATYTKQDMVRLINELGTSLVLKKDKVLLETNIQKKQQEIEYKKEYFERIQKKAADLESILAGLEGRSREIKTQIEHFKAEKDAAIKELQLITELEKKAEVLNERNAEIETLTERVKALELKIHRLTPEYEEKLKKKDRLERDLKQTEDEFRSLSAEYDNLIARREHLFTKIPSRDKIAERQQEAERSIVENTAQIEQSKGQCNALESELPPLRANSGALKQKIETLTALRENLQSRVAELNSADSKEDLLAEIESLTAKKEALSSSVDGQKNKSVDLSSSITLTEKSIKDEEQFTGHFSKLSGELEAAKTELSDLEGQIEGLMMDEEADRKLIEMLGPLNDYVGGINGVLSKLAQDYKTSVEKVMITIVDEVK
ncbi:MAG: hypothetical protein L7F77_07205 [Candidatus Magnetominusculus sp. LBB02]|nr:hypothetical protein [Candidatus Magnetominusculus sp. LBB02]